jgi:hypothetical protein
MAYTEKYITVTGAGAHDGSDESNAWTLAEAITNGASAQRMNIKAGTYTLTGNITLKAGAAESPIVWRGYNSTIGDLMTVGRSSATGELDTTNFPVIDGTSSGYIITLGAYNSVQNLSITGVVNNALVSGTVATSCNIWRCRIENTHSNGGGVRCIILSTTYGSVLDCDLTWASTNATGAAVGSWRGSIHGCRVWNSSGKYGVGIGAAELGSTVHGCLVFDCVTGISCNGSGNSHNVCNNTVYNTTTALLLGSSGHTVCDNIFYKCSGYAIGGGSAGNNLLVNNAMGELTSGRIDPSNGGNIEEIDAITLTADPFTDAANDDYTLNTTSGGGALCRGAGAMFSGYLDVGAIQSRSAGESISVYSI